MKYMNMFDKIQCIFDIIFTSPIYVAFFSLIVVLIVALFTNVIKRKITISLISISYLILLALVILNNTKSLAKVFDNFMTNLFTNIYFPSTYTYLFIMLIIDIITLTTLFNKKIDKSYKIANGICFFANRFLSIFIIELLAKNKIDLFVKKSLFGNKKLVMLLESSMNIFIIWIIALIVIYITNKLAKRIYSSKTIDNTEVNFNNELIVNADSNYEDEYNNNTNYTNDNVVSVISNNYNNNTLSIDTHNYNNEAKEETINYNNNEITDGDTTLNKLLSNELPVINTPHIDTTKEVNNNTITENIETNKKDEKDTYTLNDYKVFSKILKEIQRTNKSNIINIDRGLEIRLLMKYPEEEYNLFRGMLKNYSN